MSAMPQAGAPFFSITLSGEPAMQNFAGDCAMALQKGNVILLEGDLGAGKTSFARGFIRALLADPDHEVPSPTYTLLQTYGVQLDLATPLIAHYDLYRISNADELDEVGLFETLDQGINLIEWPTRAPELAAHKAGMTVRIDGTGDSRTITLETANDAISERLLRSFALRAFLVEAGFGGARRKPLTGDASSRSYETLHNLESNQNLIVMNAPRKPDGPPIQDGLPYSQIAHLAEDMTSFIAIDRALIAHGFCAPAIKHYDCDEGFILLENIGSEGVLDAQGKPIAERYIKSAEMLAALHIKKIDSHLSGHDAPDYQIPAYSRRAMMIEVALLADWYWPDKTGNAMTKSQRADYDAAWNTVLDNIEACEQSLVLRDFHSPNIIWQDHQKGVKHIGLIDFQDAVIGPSAYDLASLGRDARVDISSELEAEICDAYYIARNHDTSFDRASFEAAYAIMAAQRNAKILGIFIRLNRRDGKPAYLKHLPRIELYFAASLEHQAMAPIAAFFAAHDFHFIKDAS